MEERAFGWNGISLWKKRLKISEAVLFCLIMSYMALVLAPAAQAYPWPDFYGEEDSRYFSIGAQSSFFLEKKNWLHLVPAVDVKYSNVMVDVDLGWQYSVPEKKSYFRFSELALTFPIPFLSKWNFSLGLKNHEWSKADLYWNLGLWQPRYLMDPFRPVQMGHPGFYLNYRGLSSFTLHLSYISLPDLDIIEILEGGQINSRNPFFISPVTFEEDSNGGSQPQWTIEEIPPIRWGTFLKPMVALHTSHKLPHFQLSVAYAYKPSHQLQYSAFANQCSPSKLINNSCEVSGVDYSINYHHLLSLEAEMSPLKDVTLFGTLVYENPRELPRRPSLKDVVTASYEEEESLQSSFLPASFNGKQGYWISSNSANHLTASLFLYYREGEKTKEQTTVSFGYLRPLLKETNQNNPVFMSFEPLFGSSFPWTHAMSLSLEHWIKNIFHGYRFQFRLNYALDNEMYQASFENRLNLFPSFQVSLSGDLLFQAMVHDLKSGSSSIQLYKDHSRILMGARYVF